MIDYSGMRLQGEQAKMFKTQKQVARELGIYESRYCNLMNGKSEPTSNELSKMCYFWSCQLQDLAQYIYVRGEFDERSESNDPH